MNYVVFEAGSRAGYSTEMFFLDYINQTGNRNDVLYMVDDSKEVNKVSSKYRVKRISYDEFLNLDKSDLVIFPGDELSRQSKEYVAELAKEKSYSFVEECYYNKKDINEWLESVTGGCKIKVPKTFSFGDVCIRPNTMSAGTKGVQFLKNVSVTELIDIEEEYVVDVLRNKNSIKLYPRAVVLKNGYDRMIKPLAEDSEISKAVIEFVIKACPINEGLFSDVFHLQLAKDKNGVLYYIESSKRISGTSIINIFRGMNPFCFINGVQSKDRFNPFINGMWYRYEDFINEFELWGC